ncbi:MAG: hypothetical protein Q4G43_00505 [Mobilicoccus sp.]|nr:hypothetical protein [Mobilicoccus sp.]
MTRPQDHDDDVRTWLGLPEDADATEVDRTRARLEEYLADAPPELAAWARGQVSGETAYRSTATSATTVTAAAPATAGGPNPASRPGKRRRSPLVPLGIAAVAAAVVVGVYQWGSPPESVATQNTAASSAAAQGDASMPTAAAPELDEALVSDLQARIAKDPKDTGALKELANEYSRTGHFRKASETQARIVEIDPADMDARVAQGVAHFNMDEHDEAEKIWLGVLEQDPENIHAHYDLGFLYFASEPPQITKAEEAWTKVVEIDPDSQLAQTVSTHLDRFKQGAADGMGSAPADENG